jgi:hypothetical protein
LVGHAFYKVGAPVTATLAAVFLPGQLLQMTVNNIMESPLCNSVAEAANQCGSLTTRQQTPGVKGNGCNGYRGCRCYIRGLLIVGGVGCGAGTDFPFSAAA